ncbi:hypothetical protein [Flavobacterium daemonense]|uniref:hypothetical protein n=1 Tax=Flavobacterium daemonense TaxID=1393049 RepID=UPI001184AD60|nr:hypothetical protein [Flavobacterium daemonense]KAF2334319.1 hypothetical protein FND99_08440 [Flavobacterium daemonense]
MKLRMNFFSQLKMLTDFIIMSIIFSIMIFVLSNACDPSIIPYFLIPYSLLFIFPPIILHLNYFGKNKGIVFEIRKNEIIKTNGQEALEVSNNDIKEIIIYTSFTRNTGTSRLVHSSYYYAKIELLDGNYFVITSLISAKIDEVLKENMNGVKITIEKIFYPII